MNYLWGAILLLLVHFKIISSCSNFFHYYSDGNGVFGQVSLHRVPLQPSLRFEIHLSVAARIGRENVGSLILANTDVINDLKSGRDLVYKYYPPITSPLPVPIEIYLNNQQLCNGPPAKGIYVSTMQLYSIYTINGVPLPPAAPNFNPLLQETTPPPPPLQISTQSPPAYVQQMTRPIKKPVSTAPPALPNRGTSVSINLSAVCGIQHSPEIISFIIGGMEAKKNEFPWLAAFYYKRIGFICGGTLVSTKIVVTAAHCIQNKQTAEIKSASDSTFYLGKYNLNVLNEAGYVDAAVDSFIVHPDWNANDERYDGDIALGVLSRVVEFADNIVPLCIWQQSNSHIDLYNRRGLVAGWGITEKGTVSEKPMFLSLPVVEDGECLRSNQAFSSITSKSTFCVGDQSGRAPCQGDSGGAFAWKNDNRYYLRGIVSAGQRGGDYTCDSKQFVLFTDAARYSNWISNYISSYG